MQVSGSLCDTAKQLEKTVATGDQKTAIQIYTTVVKNGSYAEWGSCWWCFNASQRIRQEHSISYSDIVAAGGIFADEEQWAKTTAKLAALRHGGKWDYFYEY